METKTRDELVSMTVKELKTLCKELGIKRYSCKRKDDIIQMILDYYNGVTTQDNVETDNYTKDIVMDSYKRYKDDVINTRINSERIGHNLRISNMKQDLSENIIKFILINICGHGVTWKCKGDLLSLIEGILECKFFTSDGPSSFSPSSSWNVLYFLDGRDWLENDHFVLYRVNLSDTSEVFQNIKVNRNDTFAKHRKQGRRPRIRWEALKPQIEGHYEVVADGKLEDIIGYNQEIVEQ